MQWYKAEPYQDYSAMRWPCSEWFHIPTEQEWIDTYDILVWLWISLTMRWDQMTYLKLPATWVYCYWGSLTWRNEVWQYRCSDTDNRHRGLINYWFYWRGASNGPKNYVCAIRPRKDIPVIPDNSWTVIFDWSSQATGMSIYDPGIYYNQDDKIISLSSDWENWITIADRNVWATQAWTSKNTACVWKVFQRWNNYWFTYNWSSAPTFPSTTSTKIDASSYWPSEYSSSTYYDWWSNQDWAISSNDDLRWWVTWVKSWYRIK